MDFTETKKMKLLLLAFVAAASSLQAANPIIAETFTADPAPIVHNDTVYLYVGHDEAKIDGPFYVLNEWLCYSSTDLVNWQSHGSILKPQDFKWAKSDAWAAHTIERDGKFYFYTTVRHNTIKGYAIGVAVADHPAGPFKDARGSALITNDMTTKVEIDWDDIDPAAFIDDDGQAWIFWGNTKCYYAKLKSNMIELDGPIQEANVPHYTEAPWIHKKGALYYLSYASGFPEKTAYATAPTITGPWTYRGLLAEVAGNSNTIHQGIIEYKGSDYFFYHNGAMPAPNTGGSFRRSVTIDHLNYNADGTLQRVIQTSEGVHIP